MAIAERAVSRQDSWAALAGFMEEINIFMAADRGCATSCSVAPAGPGPRPARAAGSPPAMDALIRRARDDGYLRPDVERADLLLADVTVDAARAYTAPVAAEQWRRCLALVLDGLRARRDGPAPLPQPPLDEATANRAMALSGSYARPAPGALRPLAG